MLTVAYITPNFTLNAVRFIESLVSLHDIRVVIISQEPTLLLPPWQQSRIGYSIQLPDVFDGNKLIEAIKSLPANYRKLHRVLGATEQLQIPLAQVRESLHIEGMDVETTQNFRDKSLMKEIFGKKGIPCARHKQVTNLKEAIDFSISCPYPFVVKPNAGAGSQTTFRINNELELREAFMNLEPLLEDGIIVEEFITGDEFSLDTFSLNGKIISQSINQYYPTPLEVMNTPWIQWRVILRQETTASTFDDIRTIGKRALDALGMKTGMTHMEWFRRKDGSIAISEIAARPPGAQFTTLISRAFDFDVVRTWMKLMIYNKTEIPSIKYSSGAAYLRSQGNDRIRSVEGVNEIRSKYNDIITDIKIPKPGQEKSASYEGEGFIIVRHKDSMVVEQALKEIVETVKVR